MRECQKIWGGMCILYYNYRGGFARCISTVQNTQASPEILPLPQIIPTSLANQKGNMTLQELRPGCSSYVTLRFLLALFLDSIFDIVINHFWLLFF